MTRNPFIALWQDWIAHPALEIATSVWGALRFTLFNLALVPGFIDRHIVHPPKIHMFPERLYTLVSRLFSSNLLIVAAGAALWGRVLNGGLIFLPVQQLLFAYALRGQLVSLTVAHILPGMVTLLLIARAGMGIAVRTTLARQRGVWPAIRDNDPVAMARASDQLILPRALAVGMTGGALGLVGMLALIAGFAFEWDAVRFATSPQTLLLGFGEFAALAGLGEMAYSVLKCGFIGTAIGFVSCYEGLRGDDRPLDAYRVVGRTFTSGLAVWLITDLWMSFLWDGGTRLVYGTTG